MKIALLLEYDGTSYSGFQYQNQQASVQGEVERAIKRLTKEELRLRGASRTDAGAHAKGQVAAFVTGTSFPTRAYVGGINRYLPADIVVKAAARVEDSFDARHSARWRTYRYLVVNRPEQSPLWRNRAAIVSGHLNEKTMAETAAKLVGLHDFARLVGSGAGSFTWRKIREVDVRRSGDVLTIEVVGNAFLPRMMRNIAGSLIYVGAGQMDGDSFGRILEGRDTWRGPTAPACGLYLTKIEYEQTIPWEPLI